MLTKEKGACISYYTNKSEKMESKILDRILEWSLCVIAAVILAIVIRYYMVAPTMIQQKSMYPTLKEGQRVILNRLDKEYSRGDIITFEAPTIGNKSINLSNPIATYSYEPTSFLEKLTYNFLELNKTSYIKRIIAIEGDRIQIKNGKVYLNGEELQETYLVDGTITKEANYNDIIVPEGCVFVMGDNRSDSMDSRSFGCIPLEKLEGTVWIRYWPIGEFGNIK